MKVLLASPHFPPHHVGGVESYTKRLADRLVATGSTVAVICIEHVKAGDTAGATVQADRTYGYPVFRLDIQSAAGDETRGAEGWRGPLATAVDRIVEQEAPDVLHLHSGYLVGEAVMGAAERRHLPSMVTLHDFWFICPRITLAHPSGACCTGPESPGKCAWCVATERRRYRIPDRLTGGRLGQIVAAAMTTSSAPIGGWSRPVSEMASRAKALLSHLAKADLVLAPSRFLRDQMERAGVPAGRIVISRYGIETPPVAPRTERDGCRLRVGYLGQLAPHKGVGVLLKAVRRLRGKALSLDVHGDPAPHPEYYRALQSLAAGDPRVAFRGAYPHHAVYAILSTLDVVVVPSVWYENAPFVIQEAHAAGVPVITSDMGGMRELVQHEANGLLFAPGDDEALAGQLSRLLDDRGLLERLRPDGTSVRSADDEFAELLHHYESLTAPV